MSDVTEIDVYGRLEVAYARVDSLWEQLLAMESQRDEARAELDRLRAAARDHVCIPVEYAYAEGYTAAVAALRDDERYRNWWSADGAWQHKTTCRYWDGTGRRHLADYLETVGPARTTGEDT